MTGNWKDAPLLNWGAWRRPLKLTGLSTTRRSKFTAYAKIERWLVGQESFSEVKDKSIEMQLAIYFITGNVSLRFESSRIFR